ncbi:MULTISPECIES: hypothetical protein [Rothia]|uniref:DUF2273 domain-containing protein n=1 Tax=Rothia kristinae TaxID=37923 RepID=A0A147E8Y5_9MICC|nr:hypothetical protein [Rothia kristinae]MBE8527232.1 hypothetical protein [Amycolatopsis sp. H6(2020)]TDP53650.1 hypothetical protein DEU33_1752 [Kocuria sp. AG109]SIL92021.1 Uncharacterised protein [Mycobacteroides abscessus subsp. abscessus]KTR35382.1 membrane protein [Rothia kristinae]KTR53865.1 membrane protein [Rothia kristinae]
MNTTRFGLLVGLVLGIVAAFGTFSMFLIVVLFGAIGLVVGLVLEGRLDLRSLMGKSSDRR